MPPKSEAKVEVKVTIDELLAALTDKRYVDALAAALAPALDKLQESKFATLNESISVLQDENVSLRRRLTTAEHKIDELDNTSRLDTLIFKGIAGKSYAERATASATTPSSADQSALSSAVMVHTESSAAVETTVLDFIRDQLHVPIERSDISAAYPLKADKKGLRPIMVRFTTRRVRDTVFRNKKELKNSASRNVYISESLTRENANLFYQAREGIKTDKVKRAWTQGGHVFVKFTVNATEKPTLIRDVADLLP